MTDLMSNQKVEDSGRCFFPLGKSQDTGMDIELCSVAFAVLDNQILSCQNASNTCLDFVVDHGGFV